MPVFDGSSDQVVMVQPERSWEASRAQSGRGAALAAQAWSTVFLVKRGLLAEPAPAQTVQIALAPDSDGITSSEVGSLKTELEALLELPADAPELKTLLNADPRQVMSAARLLAQEVGNEKVIRLLVNSLASMELLSTPSQIKGRRPTPNPWLDALAFAFYTPEILSSAENTCSALRANLKRLQEPTAATTPDGRPMPRKRQLDASGRAVASGRTDSALSLAKSEAELQALIDRYPRFLFSLADHYALKDSQVNAFEAFSRAMLLDFDAWKKVEKRYYGPFLDSATFMVLSAHKTEQVLALYSQVPLKQADLQRLVLDQIDKRTQIYARARTEFTNNAAISQALVDLLQTLIEDASIDEILPAKEKRKFLELIGDAAVARRQYVEAVGVYTSLGDTRRLTEVGRQLSQRVYYDRQGTVLINRDLELAIDAFREANDTTAMLELLVRCRQAQAFFEKRSDKPTGYPYLAQYITTLEGAVDSERSAGRTLESGTGKSSDTTTATLPKSDGSIELERLPGLIRSTRDQINSALPGQDVSAEKARLLKLGEQAVREGLSGLAIEAFEPLGAEGRKRLVELGRSLLAEDKCVSAYDALKLAGKEGYPDLVLLGQKIVASGVSAKGSFNPDISLAVEAFILTDETERLETLLNDMLKFRIQLQQSEASMQGAAHSSNRGNRDALEAAIARIAQEYDLVGITYDPSKAPKRPGEGSGAAVSEGASSSPTGTSSASGGALPSSPAGSATTPLATQSPPARTTPTRVEPTPTRPEPQRAEPLATQSKPTRTEPARREPIPQDPLDLDPSGTDSAMPEPLANKTSPGRMPALEPVKPEPVKSAPVKGEPVKPEPQATKTTPTRTMPTRVPPVQLEPTEPEPVKAEPARVEPVKPEPQATKTTPTRTLPTRVTPVPLEPMEPEPVKAEPVRVEPVKPEPQATKTTPTRAAPVRTEPVAVEPVKSQPVKSQPVKSQPVMPEPQATKTAPTRTSPTTEPIKGEPVKGESVKPDPLAASPVDGETPETPSSAKPGLKPAPGARVQPVARTGEEKPVTLPPGPVEPDGTQQERPSSVYRPVLEP